MPFLHDYFGSVWPFTITLGQFGHLPGFFPPYFTFSTIASYGSPLIIIVAFSSLFWVFPHTHACPPNKTCLVTGVGDDNIERRVGLLFFFCFWTTEKSLHINQFKIAKILFSFTPWLSPDRFAYSAGTKARRNASPKEKYQEQNTTEDSWGKRLL